MGEDSVAVQATQVTSPLSTTRRLLAARRAMAIAPEEPVAWLELGRLTAYRRGEVLAAANLGETTETLDVDGDQWTVLFDTHGSNPTPSVGKLTLAPEQALLATSAPSPANRREHRV